MNDEIIIGQINYKSNSEDLDILTSVFNRYAEGSEAKFIALSENEFILVKELFDYIEQYGIGLATSIPDLVYNESCCYIFDKNDLII